MLPSDTQFDMTSVLNSLIGTVGAVEINRQNTTPAVAQTPVNPAPGVIRPANENMPYILAGGAVLVVALFFALK